MAYHVFIKRYHQEPERVTPDRGTTARQAIRLLGSYISGKRRPKDLDEAYAVGRYGWKYSQNDLRRLTA